MTMFHGEPEAEIDPKDRMTFRLNQRLNGQLDGIEDRLRAITGYLRKPGPEMDDGLRHQLVLEQQMLLSQRKRLIELLDRDE